jgi:hypothetical protein
MLNLDTHIAVAVLNGDLNSREQALVLTDPRPKASPIKGCSPGACMMWTDT